MAVKLVTYNNLSNGSPVQCKQTVPRTRGAGAGRETVLLIFHPLISCIFIMMSMKKIEKKPK